jgi:hypothetical protein
MPAKETRSREELAGLVLREAQASGECGDLHSVRIIGPIARGHSNWDIGTSSSGPNLVSAPCRIELNMIVGRLQTQFDLSDK